MSSPVKKYSSYQKINIGDFFQFKILSYLWVSHGTG